MTASAGPATGQMDRKIVLQIATATQSASGESTFDWDTASNVELQAQWLAAGTTETWKAQQRLEGTIDGMFRIHWRNDVTPENTRILWDGKVFDVRPPIEGGRRRWLDIPVTAIA